jgi:hypothetical protein
MSDGTVATTSGNVEQLPITRPRQETPWASSIDRIDTALCTYHARWKR